MLKPLTQIEFRPGWWLSSERALYLNESRTLVIADIHWGYARSHREIGNLLPAWGDEDTAQRLDLLLAHYQPERMVWLGDSLHTKVAANLAEAYLERIRPLEVIVIAGNHDRAWPRADRTDYQLGPCFFHHGDKPRDVPAGLTEIIGHIHPAISWSDGAGLRLKLHALIEGPRRLILPSFSQWSSGATWNDQLEEGERMWLISPRRIWPVRRELLGSR